LPDYSVDIVKKGLKTRPFSYDNAFKESFTKITILIIVAVLFTVFYIWLLIYTFKKSRKRSLENDRDLIDHLYNFIEESNNKIVIFGKDVSKDEIKKLVQVIREYYWDRRQKIDKALFSGAKPVIKDLESNNEINKDNSLSGQNPPAE